ncbi:hypothetical protein TPHA_0C04920 [Tetrapisispora phaffii CBS 4417]|uniref:Uncharacterized protein n=1 Tax=Tetrapisispora phaffii (strain ATCC 24235 / CBS 4417 / NBRC 1672 / NRRL Y-8282 / UCD 70-5) TaxID=1071381 RepID=G8BQX8_TETPH|nr:hypothetical protein TPHA_0C04920 [Tetrapisispora phaffii CBS 4417]CCE62640.1 hypothetical protein TPHA_0C04920 [Tetrapisispora phaffii CBS 4417]
MDRRYQQRNQYHRQDEKERCLFYYKVGVCRHGNKCSKSHTSPNRSHTIVLLNLVDFPRNADVTTSNTATTTTDESDKSTQETKPNKPTTKNKSTPPIDDKEYDSIYEDLYIELAKYGRIMEMYICDNGNDHLRGNVYVRYSSEQNARDANNELNTRWFNGKPIYCDLTHIHDFGEAICRKPEEKSGCERGDHCNFMHIRKPSPQLQTDLENAQRKKFQLNSNPYISKRA